MSLNLPVPNRDLPADDGPQTAYLAGGCFWCTEGVFELLPGVSDVTSGYAGGDPDTADYESVCTGRTGHAEVVRVTFDPSVLSYGELLRVFFGIAHDPTTLNRQGADRGTQYRSAIFYQSEEERAVAAAYIEQLDAAGVLGDPVVTTLEPLDEFHEAERYHQDFARRNPAQPYVACTALPKVAKLRAYLKDRESAAA